MPMVCIPVGFAYRRFHELRAVIGKRTGAGKGKPSVTMAKNSLAAEDAWLWVAQAKAKRE